MRWPRSLFGRIVLLQTLQVVAIAVLFGAMFYAERNRAVARLFAERWEPVLRSVAQGEPVPPQRGVIRSDGRPANAVPVPFRLPRLTAIAEAFADRGLPVADVVVDRGASRGPDGPRAVWVKLGGAADADGPWVSLPLSEQAAGLPGRLVAGLGAGAALIALGSLLLARHLTRPLASLQADIASYDPRDDGQRRVVRVPRRAPRELASIAETWNALVERAGRHERERSMALAALSHDLRGPLSRIRLAAEMSQEAPDPRPRWEVIVRNVQVADRLIEGFLSYLRAGEMPVGEHCDLARIVVDVAERTAAPAGALVVDAPEPVWIGQASALLLDCAVQNLVDNAFRHGRPPVRIAVRVDRTAAIVEVVDHGPGIDPALRPTVTDAFVRGDASRSRPGSGLGLAIVDRAVHRMGGTVSFIDLPDEAGHGIRLRFPCLPNAFANLHTRRH